MSYLHCPTCRRAYNLATQPSCSYCRAAAPVIAPPAAPTDLTAAVEQLARALAQATPAERAAAAACMAQLAAPAADPPAREPRALMPVPPRPAPRHQPMLATIAFAVLGRIAPHAPRRLLRAVGAVGARVRALAT